MIKGTFLGTGTSQGVPVIACNCEVCTSLDYRDQRLRTSFYASIEGVNIVIDTGPDFRTQMLRERINKVDAVLFTHEHKDHTAGLDDVRAYNFVHDMDMPLYGEERVLEQLKVEFAYAFAATKYPGVPRLTPITITEDVFEVKGIEIQPVRGLHYKLPVLGFRIGDMAYLTDMNHIVEEEKLQNLEVLVINALRKEEHISHFTLDQALEVIERLQPKQAYLTHLSHLMGKHKDIVLPENVAIAYDGLQIEID